MSVGTVQGGSRRTADVAVVGLGAMGAAALYQLAKGGADVIGIDRFDPPHARGSSHGGSRVTREAVAEGPAYVPFVRRTHEILADLETEFGETLLVKSGTLIVGSPMGATPLHGANDFLATSIDLAQRFGIPHEVMDCDELRRRFPQFLTFKDSDRGYLEPEAGFIRPEASLGVQLRAARALGARTLTNTKVLQLEQRNGIVALETSAGLVEAKRVVVAAGAWARGLLGAPFTELLTVTRQLIHWFEATDYDIYAPSRFPTFIWFVTDRLEDYFTGFPVLDPAEGLKVVASRDGPDIDHETIGPHAEAAESQDFFERHVAGNLAGVTSRVVGSGSCFYTNTPDNGFIVDDHPAMDRVLVVSACSGHGYKHSLGLGEAIAERILAGRSRADLSRFALDRFPARGPVPDDLGLRPIAPSAALPERPHQPITLEHP